MSAVYRPRGARQQVSRDGVVIIDKDFVLVPAVKC